ncbi:unnamed protein product [Tenebrio molitor]|nr:unnamed protein product [Tenebrio molitor]
MGQMKLKNCADQRTVVCGFREMSYRSRFGILMPTFYKGSTSLRSHSRRLETIRKSPLNGRVEGRNAPRTFRGYGRRSGLKGPSFQVALPGNLLD